LTLVGGGIVLSESAELSGLLAVVADGMKGALLRLHSSRMLVMVGSTIMLASGFNQSVVAPAIASVLTAIGEDGRQSYAILSGLALNCGQLLPFSSLANALVSSVSFEIDEPPSRTVLLLSGRDYFLSGIPAVVISMAVLLTVGVALTTILNM
jgi:di/tricarboxylate transporter